jgi:hypothetical protein
LLDWERLILKPTVTIGKLHFDDLDPLRYEDLSLAMVYRLRRWNIIHHFGRKGNDDGIDVYAEEELENGAGKTWFIQCKRYICIKKRDLKDAIDKVITKNDITPDVFLLVAACDITKANIEYFKKYASEQGIKNPQLWTASIIETKLYSEYHDLLFAFFGVNLSTTRNNRIETIKRNIKMKHRMKVDFIKKQINPIETMKRPYKKFEFSEAIIHSVDDYSYPKADETMGISGWFKVELYNFYYNGIEVIIGIEKYISDSEGYWDIAQYDDITRLEKYDSYAAYAVGRIPYENIVEYDLSGDDFYNCPHIYCDFKDNGMPYEDVVYYSVSHETDGGYSFDYLLDNKHRKALG